MAETKPQIEEMKLPIEETESKEEYDPRKDPDLQEEFKRADAYWASMNDKFNMKMEQKYPGYTVMSRRERKNLSPPSSDDEM